MKKTRIILTAIVALATVSGALAFKAQKFTKSPFFAYDSVNKECTIPVEIFYTTEGVTTVVLQHYSSATVNGDCSIGVRASQ